MIFCCIKEAVALPIRAMTSASVPPCLAIVLPRQTNVSTFFSGFPNQRFCFWDAGVDFEDLGLFLMYLKANLCRGGS